MPRARTFDTVRRLVEPRLRYVVLLALVVTALSTRVLPLAISSYPFNNDGLTESGIAEDIATSGHLEYPEERFYPDTHSVLTPAFNVMLAFVSEAVGSSPVAIAQLTTAFLSVLTITCVYVICLVVSRSIMGAAAGAMFIALFGTFVYLTGSVWKESLGMALLVMLVYAYMHRGELRMLALELLILSVLPFVHHLVAFVAYATIAFLTIWSLYYSVRYRRTLDQRRLVDIAVLALPCIGAYMYYQMYSLDRLSLIESSFDLVFIMGSFVALSLVAIVILRMEGHSRMSFAPIPALAVLGLVLWDYLDPLFPYTPGAPPYMFVLVCSLAVIVWISWIGLEKSVESRSRYRAVPLCLLMPFFLIASFALLSGFVYSSQQIIFRSFDFADLGLATGIAVAVAHYGSKPKLRGWIVAGVIALSLVSFPFGYASSTLIGVRHDTLQYEVDAVDWIGEHGDPNWSLQSDERLSYIAMAMGDFEKEPRLPDRIVRQTALGGEAFYVYEEEWTTKGVNDFPRGHPILNQTYVHELLSACDICYVGGPDSNNVIVFSWSTLGWNEAES